MGARVLAKPQPQDTSLESPGELLAAKQVETPQTADVRSNSQHTLALKRLMRESEILKDLDHQNIVEYLGFEETPTVFSM